MKLPDKMRVIGGTVETVRTTTVLHDRLFLVLVGSTFSSSSSSSTVGARLLTKTTNTSTSFLANYSSLTEFAIVTAF